MLLGILHPPLPGTSEAARWRKKQKQNPWGSVPCLGIEQRVHTSSNLGMQESSNVHFFLFESTIMTLHTRFIFSWGTNIELHLSHNWPVECWILHGFAWPFYLCFFKTAWNVVNVQFYLDSFDWLEFSDDFNIITGSPHDRSSARKPQWNLDSRRNYPRILKNIHMLVQAIWE